MQLPLRQYLINIKKMKVLSTMNFLSEYAILWRFYFENDSNPLTHEGHTYDLLLFLDQTGSFMCVFTSKTKHIYAQEKLKFFHTGKITKYNCQNVF